MTKENPIVKDSLNKEQKSVFLSEKFCKINNDLYNICRLSDSLSLYEKKQTANILKEVLSVYLS